MCKLCEARVTIEIEGFRIREAVCYRPDEEEKVLMDLAYDKIREGIKAQLREEGNFFARLKLKAIHSAVPKGVKLMQEIVLRANAYYHRSDPLPETWARFKAWAIARGFLAVKEVSDREQVNDGA